MIEAAWSGRALLEHVEEDEMAQLIVRDVDADLVARLERRAADLGCSVEEVHREVLRRALRDDDSVARRLREIPMVGEEADFVRRPEVLRELDL